MKTRYFELVIILCIAVINGCTSTKSKVLKKEMVIQQQSSFVIEGIQYQRWISESKGEGSGYHIYISVSENRNHAIFDSVYFKGYVAKIEVGKMGYFASIQTPENQEKDLIMSGKNTDEFGNTPQIMSNKQYDFAENTCVIRYIEKGEIIFYKYKLMTDKH